MSQIPIGWLMKKGGFEETPLTTGFYDDRWYTKPAPLFYQKDIIDDDGWNLHEKHRWQNPSYMSGMMTLDFLVWKHVKTRVLFFDLATGHFITINPGHSSCT